MPPLVGVVRVMPVDAPVVEAEGHPAALRARTSRPYRLRITLKSVSRVSHRQKPSWCLAVKQTYSMPLRRATSSQASGSKRTGLNRSSNFAYSRRGMPRRHWICSCQAGIAQSPQWMNIPKRRSKNQSRPSPNRSDAMRTLPGIRPALFWRWESPRPPAPGQPEPGRLTLGERPSIFRST